MSSSALMYSCPPCGCSAQKRPNRSLPYYFRFVNIIPDRATFSFQTLATFYCSLFQSIYSFSGYFLPGKSQCMQFSIREWTVNKLFDDLAYLALGSCLILFTKRPLGPDTLTEFGQCLAKLLSKPFSVCPTLLS